MTKPKEVGLTYNEYLKQVRAKQLGYVVDEVTPITEDSFVKPKSGKKKGKGKK